MSWMEVAKQRAAAGAKLLDEHVPQWRTMVTMQLDQMSIDDCVLAQVFRHQGVYHGGLEHLGLTEDDATKYGFNVYGDVSFLERPAEVEMFSDEYYARYRMLTEAWTALLAE